VSGQSPELLAARDLAAQTAAHLHRSAAFRGLPAAKQAALLGDLHKIRQALAADAATGKPKADPYALTLETPDDFRARLAQRRQAQEQPQQPQQPAAQDGQQTAAAADGATPSPRTAATETLAARAGALSDEINFPAFVASLVHGTYDAIVDATIRQMEAFAELVSAVAKDVDEFTRDNVTPNQARDWLVQQYPSDLSLAPASAENPEPRVQRHPGKEDEEAPGWLGDFGLDGQDLTDDVIEDQLVPAARRRYGESRLRTLATMVLLGMNRVNVKDGTISARLRFRATAQDKAKVDYAVSQDPATGGTTWGQRGSNYDQSSLMVSTVGVNVQADTELNAELFGEVKINFVSETLPLDKFIDSARLAALHRNARSAPTAPPNAAAPAPTPAPATAPTPASAPTPVPPQAAPPTAERK
jgi:hypothetical protein